MSSNSSVKSLAKAGWVGNISLMLTVIFGLIGIYSLIASIQDKVPMYTVESTSLISKSHTSIPRLVVTYAGKPVNQLASTNIRFWNAGKRSIRLNDISRTDPLRICVPDGVKILGKPVIVKDSGTNAKPIIKSIITSEGECLSLQFEFLDYNEGFSLQILNDGSSSINWKVKGKFIESRPVSQFIYQPERYSTQTAYFMLYLILLLGSLYMTRNLCRLNQSYSKSDKAYFVISCFFVMYLIYRIIANFQVLGTIPISLK